MEPANANPTNVDMIRRFGGSTSVEMQWPAEQEAGDTSCVAFSCGFDIQKYVWRVISVLNTQQTGTCLRMISKPKSDFSLKINV